MTVMGMGYACPRCGVPAGEPCRKLSRGGAMGGRTGNATITGVHDARRQLVIKATNERRANVARGTDVPCPQCGVQTGKPCLSGSGDVVNTHPRRRTSSERSHRVPTDPPTEPGQQLDR